MTQQEILEIIEDAIRDIVPEYTGQVSIDSKFEGIGIDSLSQVDLVVHLERALDVQIPDEALPKLRSVRDAVDFLHDEKLDVAAP